MKKIFYWDSAFNAKTFKRFVEFSNNLNSNDLVEVWLDSEGGYCIFAEMAKVAFECFDKDKFTLIGTNKLYSAALDLFVSCDCNKFLVPGTLGMTHTISKSAFLDGDLNPRYKYSEEKCNSRSFPMVTKMENKLKEIFNEEDFINYYKNEDIWLSYDQIKKILT